MPLYRFNLEDDRFIADRGVHDCLDEEHAREFADEKLTGWCRLPPN
jgi:hypothetical protein